MNRKHALAILDADQRVGVTGPEQQPPQRRGAVIARETVWHDKTKASARPRETNGTFDKQLIRVGVPIRLRRRTVAIAARIAPRPLPPSSGGRPSSARSISHGGLPMTASKPRSTAGSIWLVAEHFGKLERPMEEAVATAAAATCASAVAATDSGSALRPCTMCSASAANSARRFRVVVHWLHQRLHEAPRALQIGTRGEVAPAATLSTGRHLERARPDPTGHAGWEATCAPHRRHSSGENKTSCDDDAGRSWPPRRDGRRDRTTT